MDIDLYKSICNPRKFLAVRAGLDPSMVGLAGDPDFADLGAFKRGYRFDPAMDYEGADAADIARQIDAQGFAVYFKRDAAA